jgi:hypothetical protein
MSFVVAVTKSKLSFYYAVLNNSVPVSFTKLRYNISLGVVI